MGMTLIDGFPDTNQPGMALVNDSCSLLHGASSVTASLRARLRSVAPFFRTALITGEPGSGKRRAAQELHRLSHADDPFLLYRPAETSSPNAGSTSRSEAQATENVWAELFESAHGGTLVIDGPGDLSAADQACLLQLLREPSWRSGTFARTQVIAVSREPSRVLRSSGKLRQELYSMFSAVEIRILPLRDRLDDVEELASELLSEVAGEFRIPEPRLSPEALALLQGRPWPGNVAELRSVLREVLNRETRPVLAPESFEVGKPKHLIAAPAQTSMRLQDVVDEHVSKVLACCGGNKLKTAELLGVSRSTLYRMLEGMPTVTR